VKGHCRVGQSVAVVDDQRVVQVRCGAHGRHHLVWPIVPTPSPCTDSFPPVLERQQQLDIDVATYGRVNVLRGGRDRIGALIV
jgi:hypothetical protein